MDSQVCEATMGRIIGALRGLRESEPADLGDLADQLHRIAALATQRRSLETAKAALVAESSVRALTETDTAARWAAMEAVARVGHALLSELCYAASPPAPPHAAEQPPYRVLVVDDSRTSNAALCQGFRSSRFAVRGASTLEEVLIELVLFRPDIVISDVFMPDVSVEMLGRAFRSLSHGAATLLVLVSASTGDDLQAKLKAVKPDLFLAKAVGVSDVVARTIAEWNRVARP